jgi:Arc/MetJ-type ribon-helix-helix transcriptional regulator
MRKKDPESVRTSITLPGRMWEEVKAYHLASGAFTVADAIRRLLRDALDEDAKKRAAKQ